MENTEGFGYRRLIAYQKAKEVVKRTYKLLKKFPKEEQYAMCDQLRRASISITSNIAEGMNRYSGRTGGRVPVSRIIGVSNNQ